MDHAGGAGFDLAGDADPDRADGCSIDARVEPHRADRVEHCLDDRLGAPARREADAPDDPAEVVHGDGIGLRAPDIQPDLHRPTSLRKAAPITAYISP
jgi:hypothetical protein